MTIKEFAKIAGVSVSTVSKIMNQKDDSISSETRDHVLKLAKEYNYKAYAAAASASSKTWTIGVILSNQSDGGKMINGILRNATTLGYSVIFRDSAQDPSLETKNLMAMIRLNVDGILWEPLTPEAPAAECAAILQRHGLPYIILSGVEKDAEHSLPHIDFSAMGYLAANSLIEAGHSAIACLLRQGNRTDLFFEGYKKCLFDHSIPYREDLVFSADSDPSTFLSKLTNHQFSGLVSSHYGAALELYRTIDSLHFSIPYDLSVVTLKDDARLEPAYPPLSALSIPHEQYGAYITENLICRIEKKDPPGAFDPDFSLTSRISIDIPYNSRNKRILSIGSLNIDNYLNFETLPRSGKAVITQTSTLYAGGKCLNEAVGLAKLGHNVTAIGCVGNDSEADMIYATAQAHQIDTVGIQRADGYRTGQAYIFVQQDGNSMISIMSGANNLLSPADITANEQLFQNASCCLLQTEIPLNAITEAAKLAKKHQLTTVLKPTACSELSHNLLDYVDLIVPNADELNEICPSKQTLQDKAQHLLNQGVKAVIVTLGDQGVYLCTEKLKKQYPAARFVSIDSSGAADSFISALVSYLIQGYSIENAVQIAIFAAGLSTTRQGVVPSLPDKNSLESYIRRVRPELLNF